MRVFREHIFRLSNAFIFIIRYTLYLAFLLAFFFVFDSSFGFLFEYIHYAKDIKVIDQE